MCQQCWVSRQLYRSMLTTLLAPPSIPHLFPHQGKGEDLQSQMGTPWSRSWRTLLESRRIPPPPMQPVNSIEEQEEYPTTEQEENTTSEQVTLEESTKVTLTPPPPTPPFVYRPLVNGLADVTLTSPVPQPPALQPPAPSVMIPPILIHKTATSWSSVDVSLFIN